MTAHKKTAKQTNKKPEFGWYALDHKELIWDHCREDFSKKINSNTLGFYFSCKNKNFVSSFIEKTEDILINASLHKINRSKFYSTNLNFVIWIEPSDFWMCCSMKRSLFTMLLRCGLEYNPDLSNYECSLFDSEYSKTTKRAIERFLYGFTEFVDDQEHVGIGKGWVSFFSNKDPNLIYKKLRMPTYLCNDRLPFVEEASWL